MWIDGRRAFRPDGNYYRNTRRARLSGGGAGGPSRRGSMLGVIVAVVAVLVIALAWLLLK